MSTPSDERQALLERRLAVLKERFAAELPAQVDATATLWAALREADADSGSSAELAAIRQALHRLVGSAGSFDFDEVSARARELEQQVANIGSVVEDDSLVRAIDSGMADLKRQVTESVAAVSVDKSLSAGTLPETH